MRRLRQILSSKDMSLGDKAYVKSIESIRENSSYKENREEAGREAALWFHMDCKSKQSDSEFFMLKKSDHTVGTGTLEPELQHKNLCYFLTCQGLTSLKDLEDGANISRPSLSTLLKELGR